MSRHTTVEMEPMLANRTTSPSLSPPRSPPPLPQPATTRRTRNTLNVQWNPGYIIMVALILGFCLILAVVVIVDFSAESYYSKEFKSYFIVLYGVIGKVTNLAAGLVYGEPYAPFLISIVGWAASAFFCALFAHSWWYFCEKLCTLSLPIYMAAVYFWYGLNHRRASD